MAATFANMIGIAHKGSGGMSPIFPDVCKTPTPAGPIPIPDPNIGQGRRYVERPRTVKTDGQTRMTTGAKYMMSAGDEAGAAMGIMSNKVKGACEFILYSFDVKFEGQGLCRMGDPLFHNEKDGMG